MVDKDFVQRKVSLILRDLEELTRFEHLKVSEISNDFISQAIIERLLERVIGRAIDINLHIIAEQGGHLAEVTRYRDTFMRLVDLGVYALGYAEELAKCVGLRNAIVHEYNNIDPQLLQKSIGQAVKEFNEYTQFIVGFTDRI